MYFVRFFNITLLSVIRLFVNLPFENVNIEGMTAIIISINKFSPIQLKCVKFKE